MKNLLGATLVAATLGLGLGLAPAPSAASETLENSQVWSDAEGSVSDLVEHRSEEDFSAEASASEARQRRLDALMAEAADILSTSEVVDERARLERIREEIRAARGRIDDYRFKMASAPEPSEGTMGALMERFTGIVRPTKETYRERIASEKEGIAELKTEAAEVKEAFAEGLRGLGVTLSAAQVEGLLSMATAEDIVEILAMVENLKDINNQLQRSTVNTGESLEVAKRYYGIHTVMLEVAAFMHEEFVHKVNSTYLKKLRTITQETRTVQAEAREMLRRERDPGLRKVLENNVKSQDLTLRTAAIYRDRLIEQRDSIREALNRLNNRVDVARNTYRTAQLANDLINMLRSSDESFEAIMKLDLPDLRPFENLELQREFDRLTRELEGAPSS